MHIFTVHIVSTIITYSERNSHMNKKFLTLLMLASFLATPLSAVAAPGVNELPSLNNTVNGSVTTETWGLNAKVGSGKAGEVGQFDWNTFNLGANKQVNWAFTGVSQTALNRVLDNNASQIYGKLTNSCANANCSNTMNSGKVILINPNGILFGPGSSVNLNSFTASTFDLKGAKNIKDMSAAELATYTNNIDRNFGPDIKVTFQSATDKIGSLIKMDGADVHADKTLIVLAKDIEVKNGSVLSTTLGYNYGDGTQSFSNVKLIAADGATATYQKNGYANNGDVAGIAGAAGRDYTIKMDSDGARNVIKSGNILVRNTGVTANSNIDMKKTNTESNKLVNNANGDTIIWAENKTNIEDSDIVTVNTYEVGNQATKNTYAQAGGQVRIYGGEGVDIKGTQITTAHSVADNNGGNVLILSENGNVNIAKSASNNSQINSYGNVNIEALKNVAISDTVIRAKNRDNADASIGGASLAHLTKDVLIKGYQGTTTLNNAKVAASGNTTIDAATTNTITGGSVYAAKALNIYGQNTLLENTRLGYNDLSLYKQNQINNVTVKGTTTFDDRKVTDGSLTLTASGNFTADNATLKHASLDYFTAGASSDHTAVTLNSNTGNVSFINNSNVKATDKDITANALAGSVNVLDSKLDAKRDVVLNAKNSFTTGTNINSAAAINAGRSVIVTVGDAATATRASITLDKPVLDKITYGNRMKLNATQNVKLSSTTGLNVDRVDMNAGGNNEVTADGNINFSHSILKSANGTNTITSANGGVNFDTVAATSKNGTTVNAKGDVTTAGLTKAIDMKGTKLVLNTPGNINMAIAGSNGLRVTGKEVTLKAVNGSIDYTGGDVHSRTLTPTTNTTGAELSIDKIVSNKLNLDINNKFVKNGEGYIEVKDYGGFNLDSKPEFVYNNDGSYNTNPFYNGSSNQGPISTGVDGYKQHDITLTGNDFNLIYERPTIDCPPEPPVTPDDDNNLVRLPLQTAFASKGQIVNNLTDSTANIVAAAAGIVLTDEQNEDEYTLETY